MREREIRENGMRQERGRDEKEARTKREARKPKLQ